MATIQLCNARPLFLFLLEIYAGDFVYGEKTYVAYLFLFFKIIMVL